MMNTLPPAVKNSLLALVGAILGAAGMTATDWDDTCDAATTTSAVWATE